jgi:hypothetical protein
MTALSRGAAVFVAAALAVFGLATGSGAQGFELGVENFLYRSRESSVNRSNTFGLARHENLFRLTAGASETRGSWTARFAGYVERKTGGVDATEFKARKASLEYRAGEAFQARFGRQKIGWGSGFVWNPTARFEPPKSPANPGAEQPGVDALRLDLSPRESLGLTFVVARADASIRDLPGPLAAHESGPWAAAPTWTAAWRARLLLGSTDLSFVALAGEERDGLFGFDVGRDLGPLAWHAEGAVYRGSEIEPGAAARDASRDGRFFTRLVTGVLWTEEEWSVSSEYFWNGEGDSSSGFARYLQALDREFTRALDPLAPATVRAAARAAYARLAQRPQGAHLGLRRHYATLLVTRDEMLPSVAASVRLVLGLSDGGLIVTPALAYAPARHLKMNLDLILLFGPDDSEYRLAPIQSAAQFRLNWVF